MLAGSDAAVTAWTSSAISDGKPLQLVGFGRATSDGLFRAVLWDVVVSASYRGKGIGRLMVRALLEAPALVKTERVYLMTTSGQTFYRQLGFNEVGTQNLLVINQGSTRLSG
ncbi:GNAT family N-acetyltransferase [Synechococcus sp. RedBA-s]|uniref:GNAT family N-acetyltransferase n=1 Tax=Synechococcus sp. RedBA-s TaxID=2823741 RepID=UPI0028F40777|nr:GNAT family N-acetyltransferase [Synechococcus sp. RedBA-s]